MTENINIKLPYFIGFYQGFEQEIDNVIESEVEYYQTELFIEGVSPDNYEIKDFSEFKKCTANVFADLLAEKIKENSFQLDFSNINVDSPREYNFRTDYIFAEVPKIQFEAIKNYVDNSNELKNEFAKYCMKNFKSRDGFISFVGHNCYEYIKQPIENIIAEYPNNYEFIFEGYLQVFIEHFESKAGEILMLETFEGIRDYIYENLICDLQEQADIKINELFG